MSAAAIVVSRAGVPAVFVLGCAALALRPVSRTAVVITAVVGAAALATPVDRPAGELPTAPRRWISVTTAGVAVFALVAALWSRAATPWGLGAAAAGAIAAVSEEALFRRLGYAWLSRLGPGVAVAVTAGAFALVHVPAYGWAAVPIDLGAGVLLGWQRWATGGWSSPTVTHVAANLLSLG